MSNVSARVCVWAIALGLIACSGRGPRTPEAAFERLTEAVAQSNAESLFDALDQNTRWSWMTVQKAHREAFDAVLSNFPDGPDKDQKLKRLEPGATAETAADVFSAKMGSRALTSLKGRIPKGGPPMIRSGSRATLQAASGPLLAFSEIEGRWGYSGFAAEAEDQKRRALADLELIKVSATDYERERTMGTK